jgi:sugar lactone lactonase YvrE
MAAPHVRPHVLLTDLVIGESARWHEDRLWFAHWGAQEIRTVDLAGRSEVVLRVPTTIPFSIDWLPDGRLLVVSGQEGLLLRREPHGSLVPHADLTGLSLYPWNEIVVDGRGNTYVNSIGFDFMGGQDPAPGIIALVTPDGSVRQVAEGLAFPNGMVVTPDNATLIVAESFTSTLSAFTIADDGGLSLRRVWADLESGGDGICLDADGAVWCPAGRTCLRVREGGAVRQTIALDRACFACTLGGADRRTLFMLVAEWRGVEHMTDEPHTGQVLTVPAPAPGVGWP